MALTKVKKSTLNLTSADYTGNIVTGTYGGTGVNNGARTLTVQNNNATLNSVTEARTVTLNSNLTVSGGTTGKTLTIATGDANRTLTMSGDIIVTGGGTISVATGKTLTASNTLTLTGTDGASLAIGAGGTAVLAGAASTSGLTISTARLLGRTTAGSGALEEITVSTGLSFTGGVLSCTVSSPVSSVAGLTGAIAASSLAANLSGQTMNISGSSTSCTGNADTATVGKKIGWLSCSASGNYNIDTYYPRGSYNVVFAVLASAGYVYFSNTSNIKWPNGNGAPSAYGPCVYTFVSDGTYWYGGLMGGEYA